MNLKQSILLCLLGMTTVAPAAGKDIEVSLNPTTGAVGSLRIAGDANAMDWILKTDSTQYKWVTEKYGWGLGYATVDGVKKTWEKPTATSGKGTRVTYDLDGVRVEVVRKVTGKDLTERYTFENTSGKAVTLSDLGIFTPWNDNYPAAATCMTNRCNAHIWTGGSSAYVMAERMDGRGAALGMVTTEGRLTAYDVWERGNNRSASNFRGVFALCPPDTVLQAGESFSVSWKVFKYEGRQAFFSAVKRYGGAVAESDRYVLAVGDTAHITLTTAKGTTRHDVRIDRTGEISIELPYGKGLTTRVDLYGISSEEALIEKRVNFILDHQQLNDPADPRYGAYMVYDNAQGKIYLNDDARQSLDTDEGRERVGMGVLLADWYRKHPSDRLLGSLTRYASFVRTLQKPDYTTFSTPDKKSYNRGYNYPWVAKFFFKMYGITHNRQYALDGYQTMRAFYRQFHYGFYALHIPVIDGLKALADAGLTAEHDTLLNDFRQAAALYIEKGLNFPAHEVNYEQSIVAPPVQFLCELYDVTREAQYLDGAEAMMAALESFDGQQPSYRLNQIAIRHWDGYWFGRRQTYGDTFPHYWTTLTANVFHLYARLTNQPAYQEKAEQIVRNNLCSFFEDGCATCAFVYPRMVNGEPAHYADVFANDQDWALVSYLFVNE
ncbi:MAG: six-hairpin glycosidase [Bacteroidales bacterium]|nr:six-hairpin glycosidase [Bacteroidales bacterium]